MNIHPGISSDICKMMKCRSSSFSSFSRLAVICVDEMSIKQNLYYCCKMDDVKGFEQYNPNDKRKAPATGVLVFFKRFNC